MNNDQVIRLHAALDAFVQTDRKEHYNTTTDFRLKMARNLNRVIPLIDDYSKQHNALVAKNGKKDKDGNFGIADEKAKAVFAIERQDLGQQEVEIDTIETINPADLPANLPVDLLGLFLKVGLIAA